MKVRDCHFNIATGQQEERWIELDVMTPEQAAEQDRLQAIRDANAAIQAQLDAADNKIIRALTEGDTARIAAHKASQAALRAKLKPVA